MEGGGYGDVSVGLVSASNKIFVYSESTRISEELISEPAIKRTVENSGLEEMRDEN